MIHLLITIFISTLIVILIPIKWFGLKSFVYSFPVIIFCVGLISKKIDKPISRTAGALGFLIPVIGYSAWKNAIIRMDSQYLALQTGAQQQLTLLKGGIEGTFVLLLATTVATFLWKAPKMGSLFLCALACLTGCHYFLDNAIFEIWHGDPRLAAKLSLSSELIRLIPMLFSVILCYKSPKYTRWLLIVAGIISAWMVCPPITAQLSKLPVAEGHPNGPTGTIGLGISTTAANPQSKTFAEELNAQGTSPIPSLQWWCNTKNRPGWKKNNRAVAGISPPANYTIEDLWTKLPQIFHRGITYLAIVGSTEERTVPPLNKHVKYPAVRFFLDPPPPDSTFGILKDGRIEWSKPLKDNPEACAVWATKRTTMQELFSLAQHYAAPGKQCAHKFFLLFGSPEQDISLWRSPIKCVKIPSKNQRAK